MHELPLVFFTVFGQLSAGMVFLSSLYYLVNHTKDKISIIQKINVVSLIFMAIGMIIASFHLGHPLRALNVIFGIGRSPMSNEIFTFGVLFGVTFASVVLNYFSCYPTDDKFKFFRVICWKVNKIPYVNGLLSAVLILLSIVFVWTIVLTYMLPTVKTWDTYYTALQMYTAMFALGGIASAMLGLKRLGSVVFLMAGLLIVLLKIPYANLMATITPELTAQQSGWMIGECALILVALLLVIINIWRANYSIVLSIIAFACVFVAEICGRIVFYNLWVIPL